MDISRQDFLNFVKAKKESPEHLRKSTLYYVKIYDAGYPNKFFQGWNWASFFSALLGAPAAWTAYRRMSRQGVFIIFAYFGIWILVSSSLFSCGLFLASDMRSSISNMIVSMLITQVILGLLMGFFGNFLYFHYIRRCFAREPYPPEGGTNPVAAWRAGGMGFINVVLGMLFLLFVRAISGPANVSPAAHETQQQRSDF